MKETSNLPGLGGPPYNHAEAFCLMRYTCEDCGHSEIIWNSRDGVTPFGMSCPKCHGYNMMHRDWHSDFCAPGYMPYAGQGVWVDMPESLKPVLARMRAAVFEGSEKQRADLVQALIDGFQLGEPWLIRWI